MICAHCGRTVEDGSVVCPYCGKKTSNAPNPRTEQFARMTFFPGAMILFLVFAFEMVPGTAEDEYTYYAIFAGLVAVLSGALWLALRNRHTQGALALLFLLPTLLIVSTVGLRGVYYAKYEEAAANVPASGMVPAAFTYKDTYYDATGAGYITDWDVDISVDGKSVEQGGVARVELFRPVVVEGVSTFDADGESYRGTGSVNAVLTPSQLANGYDFDIVCDTGEDVYCVLTITAIYEPDFWEVVFN